MRSKSSLPIGVAFLGLRPRFLGPGVVWFGVAVVESNSCVETSFGSDIIDESPTVTAILGFRPLFFGEVVGVVVLEASKSGDDSPSYRSAWNDSSLSDASFTLGLRPRFFFIVSLDSTSFPSCSSVASTVFSWSWLRIDASFGLRPRFFFSTGAVVVSESPARLAATSEVSSGWVSSSPSSVSIGFCFGGRPRLRFSGVSTLSSF